MYKTYRCISITSSIQYFISMQLSKPHRGLSSLLTVTCSHLRPCYPGDCGGTNSASDCQCEDDFKLENTTTGCIQCLYSFICNIYYEFDVQMEMSVSKTKNTDCNSYRITVFSRNEDFPSYRQNNKGRTSPSESKSHGRRFFLTIY